MVEFVDQYNQYQSTVRIFRVVIHKIRKASANCKISNQKKFFFKKEKPRNKKKPFSSGKRASPDRYALSISCRRRF